jgi:DNA-binding MarR family transcriptional regulator
VDAYLPRRPASGSDHFGNLFRDPHMLMEELVAEAFARRGFADLRPALLFVAQHLQDSGSRITELAERSLLTKPTVVYLVDELERLGYVRRAPDPRDGRAKLVVPTERARAAERVARETVAEIRAAWARVVGEEELASLEAGLRRLRDALWADR